MLKFTPTPHRPSTRPARIAKGVCLLATMTILTGCADDAQPGAQYADSCVGDFFVSAAADVSAIADCDAIDGDLVIYAIDDSVGLNALSTLRHVSGALIIDGTSLTNLNALSQLVSAGSLGISNNHALITLDGLAQMQSVGSLTITSNQALVQVDGLSGLGAVFHDLRIEYNRDLYNVDLPNLMFVGGRLSVQANNALSDVYMPYLDSVVGDLSVCHNETLCQSAVASLVDGVSLRGELSAYRNDDSC